LGRNWIVSVHYGFLPGLIEDSQLHERIVLALGRGPDFMLYIVLDLVVDSYFPLLDEIEEEIDTLEDRLLVRGSAIDIKRLLVLKLACRFAATGDFQSAYPTRFRVHSPTAFRLLS
jgi:magnesium transporter